MWPNENGSNRVYLQIACSAVPRSPFTVSFYAHATQEKGGSSIGVHLECSPIRHMQNTLDMPIHDNFPIS